MGSEGLWRFLRKNGHEALVSPQIPEISSSSNTTDLTSLPTIRVDVLDTFYSCIRRIYTTHPLHVAHEALEQQILRSGIAQNSVLYLDGPSPGEKRKTFESREQRRGHNLKRAQEFVTHLAKSVKERRRVRKRQFINLNKHIRAAFYWSLDSRKAFAQYMQSVGWSIVECSSEADIAIAHACQPNDIVVSTDSDMLAYDTISTIWRPISRGKFLIYDLASVLQCLGFSRVHLTVLCVVSKNDYNCNLARMGVLTNYRIIKSLNESDPETMVKGYLAHNQVLSKNATDKHFETSLRIFVHRQVGGQHFVPPPSVPIQVPATQEANEKPATLEDVLERLRLLREELEENKRSDPSSTWLTDETKTFSPLHNRYSTVDHPPDQCPRPHDSGKKYTYRKRFSFKTRSRLKNHEPPDAMKKYQWKPWKNAPDCPLDRTTFISQNKKTKPTKAPPPAKDMDKAALLYAMQWEHPTRTLNVGTINANVTRVLNKEFGQPGTSELLPKIKACLQRIVRLASTTKRTCQRAIGQYIERLLIQGIDETDRFLLDKLCATNQA